MAKKSNKALVIVESPAKARTINRYLGRNYVVRASMGHVRDLPRSGMGVDLTTFEPTYEIIRGRAKVISELKKLAREADEVYLATDLDREGEAIAWHLKEALKIPEKKARRVVFNAITKSAVQEAFRNPDRIDEDKVNAQQARRILDRIVGYEISPLLWRKVARGLSAGRVQSVAVRLITERDGEIEAFVPEEYWKISGVFTTREAGLAELAEAWVEFNSNTGENGLTKAQRDQWLREHRAFDAELIELGGEKFHTASAEEAQRIAELLGFELVHKEVEDSTDAPGHERRLVQLSGRMASQLPFRVKSLERKRTQSRPPAPFITSSLQQAASSRLSFSASQTMRISQSLYERGLVTYMRTDSTNVSPEALKMARDYIAAQYGREYLPEKPNTYRSRQSAQEAHEAIRPTDLGLDPTAAKGTLGTVDWKLYKLIWERFVACQMTPAQFDATTVLISCQSTEGEAVFRGAGRRLVFDGYLRVAGISSPDQLLPELSEQQRLYAVQLDPSQHFTQPPPRFSEASLVKALESQGIGRPSTYAAIIQTIQDRGYVEQIDRRFHATLMGEIVTEKLIKAFPRIMDVKFTANMEDKLDAIEEQHLDWVKLLQDFYGPFHDSVEQALQLLEHAGGTPSPYTCDKCGRPLIYRISKNGFFLACSGYPECSAVKPVDRQGKPVVHEQTDHKCPTCGQPMVRRSGRFGVFLGCSAYPECKTILNLDKEGNIQPPKPKPLTTHLSCPKCGKPMYLRRGKRGPWLGCSGFPRCKGRASFATLPKDEQEQLLEALKAHEGKQPSAPTSQGNTAGKRATPAGPIPTDIDCQECSKPMVVRFGKRGPFLGCSGFPQCRHTEDIPPEVLQQVSA